MKRQSRWLTWILAALLLLALPAQAGSIDALLQSFGMTQAEAQAFAAIVAEMGEDITDETIRAMLAEFEGQKLGEPLAGKTEDGVYTDPEGYAFPIPEGWTLQPSRIGGYIVLAGQPDEGGFTPTITVLSAAASDDSFLDKTQEEVDNLLVQSLKNYQPIALDDFQYQDVPARELVCMYGTDEDTMLMQYQLHFSHEGMAYIITMTTLAEEAAHDSALNTYDSFLAEFSFADAQGVG